MTDIELHPDFAPAPTTLFQSPDPALIVAQATRIAEVIKPLIKDKNLYKRIGTSDHVFLEGWTLAGTMLGVFPITVSSGAMFDADGEVYGYQATVEARTMAGAVVGRADAECTRDEGQPWRSGDSFALRSMAQTRAASKALRMPLGFVMQLAGYETTPAEEMQEAVARGETVTGGKGVKEGWRDIQEQNKAHQRLNVFVANNGLGEWVGTWLASKGYERPMSKAQMADLRRAVDRELAERKQEASEQPDPAPQSPRGPAGSGITSEERGPRGAELAPGQPAGTAAAPPSDPSASVTGPGDTGVSTGQEPLNTEATTSPVSPGGGKAGRGSRSGRGAAGKVVTKPGAPPAEPADEATEQAEFEQGLTDDYPHGPPEGGRWTR